MADISHIAFLNPQGNFDPDDSYWTEHADFGGQLVYVKEVALALAKKDINVDIITRQIKDKDWPEFSGKIDYYPENDKVRIIRLPFGGQEFLEKELLWPHIHNYVNEIIHFYEEEGSYPEAFTTHYGDGGLAGVLFNEKTGIPFTFTGHSLGAQKMDKLNVNSDNFQNMINRFKFHRRIAAERLTMDRANKIIVSTSQERYEQYSHPLYENAVDVDNSNKFSVIPPGANTEIFNGEYSKEMKDKLNNYLSRDIAKNRLDLPAMIA